MTSLFCKNCRNLVVRERPCTFVPMNEMPGFIKQHVRVLSECEDVDESVIVFLSVKLKSSPKTAGLLTAFAEIGYSNNEMLLSECSRLMSVTGAANSYLSYRLS